MVRLILHMKQNIIGLCMVTLLIIVATPAHAEVGGTITRSQTSPIDTIVNTFISMFTWNSPQGTLTFTDGRYNASAGCNTLFGAYSLRGTTIDTEGPASTMMYCEGKMENEQTLSMVLGNATTLTVTPSGLVLGTGTSTLTFTPTITPAK